MGWWRKNEMFHNVYFFRDITIWCGCTLFENDIFSPAGYASGFVPQYLAVKPFYAFFK